jgi:Ca2+-transporting ATPase
LTGLPVILGPVHIAFLEMFIDPVCALVFEAEAEEPDVMHRPPRAPDARLVDGRRIAWSALQGLCASAVVGTVAAYAIHLDMPATEVRAMTFCALVAGIAALVLVNRSSSASLWQALLRPNRPIAVIFPIVALAMGVLFWVEPARTLFGFAPVRPADAAQAIAAGFALFPVLEILRFVVRAASQRVGVRQSPSEDRSGRI